MFLGLTRFFNYAQAQDHYQPVETLRGHGAAINTLAFNATGNLLASGGDDEEVRLWDLAKGQQCQSLVDQNSRWGQIIHISFLYPESGLVGAKWLAFGTGRGLLVVYRRIRKTLDFQQISSTQVSSPGDSVEHFAFNSHHQRLAVSTHYGKVVMYKFENSNLAQLWGEELSETIPRAVLFIDKGETLATFGMESGNVDAETAVQKSTRVLSCCIGSVSVCSTTGNYLVDNMKTGFDVYIPNRTSPKCSFKVVTTKKYVKQGVFGERGKTAVCGSDHGHAYVFGMTSTEPLQVLKHGRKDEMIQTVEAASTAEKHLIATGSSGGKFEVCVWEKVIRSSASRERREPIRMMTILNLIFFIVLSWMTVDTWLPPVANKVNFVVIQASRMLNVHTYGKPTVPEDVQKVLAEMDEETLRKVLQIK